MGVPYENLIIKRILKQEQIQVQVYSMVYSQGGFQDQKVILKRLKISIQLSVCKLEYMTLTRVINCNAGGQSLRLTIEFPGKENGKGPQLLME